MTLDWTKKISIFLLDFSITTFSISLFYISTTRQYNNNIKIINYIVLEFFTGQSCTISPFKNVVFVFIWIFIQITMLTYNLWYLAKPERKITKADISNHLSITQVVKHLLMLWNANVGDVIVLIYSPLNNMYKLTTRRYKVMKLLPCVTMAAALIHTCFKDVVSCRVSWQNIELDIEMKYLYWIVSDVGMNKLVDFMLHKFHFPWPEVYILKKK